MEELRLCKVNFKGSIDMGVYEQFFRMFCWNKNADLQMELRADLISLNKGLQYWCGGHLNKPLAYLIYSYIGKGTMNHQISFSEFLNFVRNFQLSKEHQNVVVFHMISDMQPILTVQNMLRIFVNVPKNSPFALELRDLIRYYTLKSLRPDPTTKTTLVYDKLLYERITPYSILAQEMKYLLIDIPPQAWYKDKFERIVPNPDFKNPQINSVMFPRPMPKVDPKKLAAKYYYEEEDEIRRYSELLSQKVHSENLLEVLALLKKY